jgi:hypothetical protein
MMKVLYRREFASAAEGRKRKKEFLERFRGEGFYLIDACEAPLPKRAAQSVKKCAIRDSLPVLTKLKQLCDPDTKIVLISRPVYDVCLPALDGFNVINTEMIDFPTSGRQPQFRQKLGVLLRGIRETEAQPMNNNSH